MGKNSGVDELTVQKRLGIALGVIFASLVLICLCYVLQRGWEVRKVTVNGESIWEPYFSWKRVSDDLRAACAKLLCKAEVRHDNEYPNVNARVR